MVNNKIAGIIKRAREIRCDGERNGSIHFTVFNKSRQKSHEIFVDCYENQIAIKYVIRDVITTIKTDFMEQEDILDALFNVRKTDICNFCGIVSICRRKERFCARNDKTT